MFLSWAHTLPWKTFGCLLLSELKNQITWVAVR
jgi:hypothetical protein